MTINFSTLRAELYPRARKKSAALAQKMIEKTLVHDQDHIQSPSQREMRAIFPEGTMGGTIFSIIGDVNPHNDALELTSLDQS